jgi:hypothetical protein
LADEILQQRSEINQIPGIYITFVFWFIGHPDIIWYPCLHIFGSVK